MTRKSVLLFEALVLFFLQFNLLQLGVQIAKHLLWYYSLCIIQKTRKTALCGWFKWKHSLLGFYFWLLNCHFCSIIPAIFFLWSFLWTYCHSSPFIPLNVLVYEILRYTLSIFMGIWHACWKGRHSCSPSYTYFVWFETPWSTSFWTSMDIIVVYDMH